ncbi:MAG TPA: peroxiredoxin-like family protein [Xanthobacteraceae bacterium]|nr:peroxiredoxin-like family protein [Xanthobacteraceae bacterium]
MTTAATALRTLFEQCRDMDASLNERLEALADGVCRIDKGFAGAVDRIVLRLRQSGAGESAPHVGDPMPPFILPDETGHLVSLDGLLRNGPVAITFHRGHWCPYCRISMNALAHAQRAIAPGRGQIVAIMPERQRYAKEIKAEAAVTFPVLTDMDNGYAMSLNLAFWVDAEMQRFIAEAGRDVPSYQGNESWMFPIPATFVVGRDGLITTRFVDPDYRRRMAIDDMLQALEAAR